MKDQRCYQHHDHKQAFHLAPHYSYGRESAQWRTGTQVAYDAESVTSAKNSCNLQFTLTNSPNHNCSSNTRLCIELCFYSSQSVPVGICMLATIGRSPVFRCIRRRGLLTSLITGPPLPIPTWRRLIRRLLRSVFRRHKLPSGREVSRRLLGWLKNRRECAEQRKQMVRMLNSE